MTGVGTLGRAAVVPESNVPMVISVDVAGWRIKPKTLPVEYIALFLNSPAGVSQSERYQTGSSGQLHLYPEHVRNFRIYARRTKSGQLDLDWHDELARKVAEAETKRSRATAKLNKVHRQFASVVGVEPKIYRE